MRDHRLFGVSMVGSKIAYALAQGIQLIIIARFGGSAEVGLYALALAIASPVFLLTDLRIQDVLATQHTAATHWRTYMRLTVWTNTAGLLLTFALSIAWGKSQLMAIVIPLALAKFVDSLMRTAYGYAQGRGRRRQLVISTLARAVTNTVALALGYAMAGLVAGLWLVVLVWSLQYLAYERRFLPWVAEATKGGDASEQQAHPTLRHLLITLLPLGLAAMALSMNQSLVRLVVEEQVGLEALGTFAAVGYLVRIGAVSARGMAEVTVGRLRRVRGGEDLWNAVRGPTALVGLIGLVGGVAVVAVGPYAFPIVFGPEFTPTYGLLIGVMSAGVFLSMSTALTIGLVASGGYSRQLLTVGSTTILTLVLALGLAGPYGITGVAVAWAVGEAARAALLASQVKQGQADRANMRAT